MKTHGDEEKECYRCDLNRHTMTFIDADGFSSACQLLEAAAAALVLDVNGNFDTVPVDTNPDSPNAHYPERNRDESIADDSAPPCLRCSLRPSPRFCPTCAEVEPKAFLAQIWAQTSFCRLETANAKEAAMKIIWDKIPKRHKKKFQSPYELFKSIKKVPSDLSLFHSLYRDFEADLKAATAAASLAVRHNDDCLRSEAGHHEAHFHLARAIFKTENANGAEDKKTVCAMQQVNKFLRLRFGAEDATPRGFHPRLWLFLKELNHPLYTNLVAASPALDDVLFYDNVYLVGADGPACFADLKTATKFAVERGVASATFLLAPGRYETALEDSLEFPEGLDLQFVGNVSTKAGLRWRHVLRHLQTSVVLTRNQGDEISSLLSVAGGVRLSFARIAFVARRPDVMPLHSDRRALIHTAEGAAVAVQCCSFHCEGEDAGREGQSVHLCRCVGVMATTEGEVTVANSAFFKIGCGAVVEDGGRLALQSSSFSDTSVYGLTSSGQSQVTVESCEFVNSNLFIHHSSSVDIKGSQFKCQTPVSHGTASTLTDSSEEVMIKVKKGSTVNISNCRFVGNRILIEKDCPDTFLDEAITKTPLLAFSAGNFGTKVDLYDNSFSHIEKCVVLTDKAKGELRRNKFLDCGRMLQMHGQAKVILEENCPCPGMVPLALDEDTEMPEMKGPNTYRAERICCGSSPINSPKLRSSPTEESPIPVRVQSESKGRRFCHHCLKDELTHVALPSMEAMSLGEAEPPKWKTSSSPSSGPTGKHEPGGKKKKKLTSKAESPLLTANQPVQAQTRAPPAPPRPPSLSLHTPSLRSAVSGASSISAFVFCTCGSSYCSKDCQVDDWQEHRSVCGGRKRLPNGAKGSAT